MDLAQEIRKVIEAPQVMQKGLDQSNAVLDAAKNSRFVEYCQFNLLKYKIFPENKDIYCEGFGNCSDCPIEQLKRNTEFVDCDADLHKYVLFMKAVVDAAERDIG